jgi:ketosteroid isomerase-like protein
MKILAALLVAAAAAAPVTASAPDPSGTAAEFDAISKAERDFAAMSLKEGLKKSFLAYAAPDGVIFRPTAVPAVATLQKDPDRDGGQTLDWWPAMGTISRSHDLALSVGPWVLDAPGAPSQARRRYGYYATVWRKQPDGSWKFVIDGAGGRIASPPTRAKGSEVLLLPVSRSGEPISAEAALRQVRDACRLAHHLPGTEGRALTRERSG